MLPLIILAFDLQLASLVGSELGLALPSTIAFDYPTVEAIAGFVTAPPEPPADAAAQQSGGREMRRSSFARLFSSPEQQSLGDVFRRCTTDIY
jgi:hypothetical protein